MPDCNASDGISVLYFDFSAANLDIYVITSKHIAVYFALKKQKLSYRHPAAASSLWL